MSLEQFTNPKNIDDAISWGMYPYFHGSRLQVFSIHADDADTGAGGTSLANRLTPYSFADNGVSDHNNGRTQWVLLTKNGDEREEEFFKACEHGNIEGYSLGFEEYTLLDNKKQKIDHVLDHILRFRPHFVAIPYVDENKSILERDRHVDHLEGKQLVEIAINRASTEGHRVLGVLYYEMHYRIGSPQIVVPVGHVSDAVISMLGDAHASQNEKCISANQATYADRWLQRVTDRGLNFQKTGGLDGAVPENHKLKEVFAYTAVGVSHFDKSLLT